MVPGAGVEPAQPCGRGILSQDNTTQAHARIHTNYYKYRITGLLFECQYESQ